jgi:hypothetical protein
MPYIEIMKQIAPFMLCAMLAVTPVQAQDSDNNTDLSEGMGLLSEGTRLLLRGLMGEIEPALRDLEGALQDLNAYHAPEVLPNGDILIRRKEPKTVEPEEGEIDL